MNITEHVPKSKLTRAAFVFCAIVAPLWLLTGGAVTIPNTFTNGQVADANQVNANFSAVKSAIDDNDSRITAIEFSTGTSSDPLPPDFVMGASVVFSVATVNGVSTTDVTINGSITDIHGPWVRIDITANSIGILGEHWINTATTPSWFKILP